MTIVMMPHALRCTQRVLAAALVGLSLLGVAGPGLVAQAAISGCRADPIVYLSNGVHVQMGNTIADSSQNVQKVAYTLVGPVGTTVTSVVYPQDNSSGIVETFQYQATNAAGNYDSYSAIYDANVGTNVNATTTVTDTLTNQSVSQMAQTHLSSSGVSLHIHAHL